MAQDEDRHWLILKNVDGLPAAYGGDFVWPGSTKIKADCGCECWIAPKAREALGDPANDLMTICTNHLAKSPEMQAAIEEGGLRAIQGQRLELAQLLPPAMVDDLFRRLKVRED
jgi:hypothetical protein